MKVGALRGALMGLAILLALLPAIPATARQSGDQAPSGTGPGLAVCDQEGSHNAGEPTSSTPVAGGPVGLLTRSLTDLTPRSWPGFARGLVMTIRRLTLDAGVASEMRITQGPLLFYIERGTVGISINSRMTYHEQGEAVLIEIGQRYLLRNDLADPVGLVRVQLAPPDQETTVSRGDVAEARGVEREAIPGPPFLANQLLVRADIPVMRESTRLILACLTWTDLAAEARDLSHPGPVALLVLEGQLLVGETGKRAAGECVVFPAQVPHRLRAGDPPPVVLMIGVLPAGGEPWGGEPATGDSRASGRLAFQCGDEPDSAAAPEAASSSARDVLSTARR